MEYLCFGTEPRTGTGIVLAASICNTHVLCRKPHITKTFVEPEALKRSPRTEDDAPHIETARACAGSVMGAYSAQHGTMKVEINSLIPLLSYRHRRRISKARERPLVRDTNRHGSPFIFEQLDNMT